MYGKPMDNQTRWSRYYEALRGFAAREGHARVPTAHREVTPSGTLNLGAWVGYTRQRYRAGRLPQSRIDALNAVPDWQWGPLRPGPATDATRNADIRALRTNGMSLQQIADLYGLSRQRVHQIVS